MAGSADGVERRHTQTPFMATSRSAGSKAAPVVPIGCPRETASPLRTADDEAQEQVLES